MRGKAARIPQQAPFGTWASPISAERAAGAALRLSQPRIDGAHVYWLEGRPAEAGRQTVMRARLAGGRRGGADPGAQRALAASTSTAAATTGCATGSWSRADPAGGARLAGREAGALRSARAAARYGDFAFSPDGRWIVAVEEEHGEGEVQQPPGRPRAAPAASAW